MLWRLRRVEAQAVASSHHGFARETGLWPDLTVSSLAVHPRCRHSFVPARRARSSVADYVTAGARTLRWTGLGRMTHSHAPPLVSGGILGRSRLMVGNVDDARRQPSHTDAAISGLRRTACCSLIGTAAAIFTSPAPFLALLACTRYTTLTSSRPHLSGAETPYNIQYAHTPPLELPALGESAYPAKR